jgi:hypothetical protein
VLGNFLEYTAHRNYKQPVFYFSGCGYMGRKHIRIWVCRAGKQLAGAAEEKRKELQTLMTSSLSY